MLKLLNSPEPKTLPLGDSIRGFTEQVRAGTLARSITLFWDKFSCFGEQEAAELSYTASLLMRIDRESNAFKTPSSADAAAEFAAWWKSLLQDAQPAIDRAQHILQSHLPEGELKKRQARLNPPRA